MGSGGGAASPDTCQPKILADLSQLGVGLVRGQEELAAAGALPPWLGDPALHRSHQSALLRKDPDFYGPRFPEVPDDLPYVWPVRSQQALQAERRRLAAAARREERAARRAEAEKDDVAAGAHHKCGSTPGC